MNKFIVEKARYLIFGKRLCQRSERVQVLQSSLKKMVINRDATFVKRKIDRRMQVGVQEETNNIKKEKEKFKARLVAKGYS
ncbi:hypothetical protein CR513_62556, partial [Mucuna pruriens]